MVTISYAEAERLAVAGRFSEAEAMCNKLLKHFPDNFALLYLLSSINLLTRRYEKSRKICQKLLQYPEVNADVYNALAAISADFDGDFEQARTWLERALEYDPGHRKALVNLGNHYLRMRKPELAREFYQRATSAGQPNSEAVFGFGMIELLAINHDAAIPIFRQALEIDPGNMLIVGCLIEATAKSGKIDEAIAIARQVAESDHPGAATVQAFSIAKFYAAWDISDKLEPLAIRELNLSFSSFSLFLLANLPALATDAISNKQLLDLHRSMAQVFRRYIKRAPFDSYPKAFAPSKRIRIGYLSADLRKHVVNRFFRSLLNYRNRDQFEIFLYSSLPKELEDEVTADYRKAADHFVRITDMNDIEASQRIHDDGIHILVELGGYTTNGRYELMLYRSAPVQISYLGYPFSCGMEEIDYVISDPWLDGSKNARYFVEKPLRLPESFITVAELPARGEGFDTPLRKNGYITFGSMNNIYKLSSKQVEIWSRIMHRVPNSRMYFNHPNFKYQCARDNVMATFERHGIPADRILIGYEKHPTGEHIRYYNEMDIALDTMPQTGGTTTVEALWMGVPVVTLVGETHAERISYSVIKNVGIDLDDCISFNEKEYIDRAVALARNPERVMQMRLQIPEAMRSGIMGQPARFTAQLESAYIEAWNLKFPDMPIDSLRYPKGQQALPIGLQCQLVVRDAPDDKYAYILREQRAWFEVESAFIERNAACFEQFWDFAEDPGVFVVPYTKAQSNGEGHALAIRSNESVRQLLMHSIKHNHLRNLEIVSQPLENAPLPDLVRFSLEFNDRSDESVADWISRVGASSPLLLVSLQNSHGADARALNMLVTAGYQAYRLLPGYNLLVPVLDGEALEESDINLFFCKQDRAALLEAHGILCQGVTEPGEMPGMDAALWSHALAGLPYAKSHLASWQTGAMHGQWGDTYLLALNLHVSAGNVALPPAQRWAHIKMSQSILMLLVQEEPTVPRILTGIRVMADGGRRKLAAQWALRVGLLVSDLEHRMERPLNEPFLAPVKEIESIVVGNDENYWVNVAAKLAFERLRSFSTWFTNTSTVDNWKWLAKHEIVADQAREMVDLIEQRYARQVC